MADLILGPMLRDVGPTSATIWVETDAPVHRRGARAPRPHVHRGRPPLRARDRRGSRAGLDARSTRSVLDGERRWPLADSRFPPSVIRTVDGGPLRVLFGSCRTAAPHEPPWTLEMQLDPTGRGVDALRAHALRMLGQPTEQWPHLARDARRSGLRRRLVTRHARADQDPTRARTRSRACRPSSSATSRSTAGCTTSRGRPTSSAGSSRSCRRR